MRDRGVQKNTFKQIMTNNKRSVVAITENIIKIIGINLKLFFVRVKIPCDIRQYF